MAKPKRPSLADIMEKEQAEPVAAFAAALAPRATAKVLPMAPPAETALTAAAPEAKQGRGSPSKPHTTLYLDPAVRHAIKRIALDYNKKPHDLLLEGVDMMLVQYTGKGLKDITTS